MRAAETEKGEAEKIMQVKAAEVDRIREFNENIIESLNDGLVVLDLEDRVVRWNAALQRIYGVARDAAVGRPLATLFDAPFTERLARRGVEDRRTIS